MEQAIDLRFELRNALLPLGYERILDCLNEAARIAEILSDDHRLGRVYAYLARHFFGISDHKRAVASGQRALDLAAGLDSFDLQVTTQFYLGVAYHSLGDYPRAIDVLRKNVTSLTGDLLYERIGLPYLPAVFSRKWLVWCMAERGEFAEGMMHSEESVRIAEAIAQPWDLMVAYRSVGLLHFYKGECDQALPLLERCHTLCQRGNLSIWLPLTVATLGAAYSLAGRAAEAIPLLEQGADQQGPHYSLRVAYLSEGYLRVGQIDQAMQLAERAVQLSLDRQERGYQAWALRLLGEIHAYRDNQAVKQAEAYYQQALVLATELSMRPLQAHCHLGLGKLYSRMARTAQAQGKLSAATNLYQTMDMTFWLSEANTVLMQIGASASPEDSSVSSDNS
jgi:tetratricopeptide (TPR) repeat protein